MCVRSTCYSDLIFQNSSLQLEHIIIQTKSNIADYPILV